MKLSDGAIKAIVTAGFCTIWIFIANTFGLIGWAGFAGCTAYFAHPKSGLKSVSGAGLALVSGSAYALISLYFGTKYDFTSVGLLFTFITTFLMCYAGKTKYLSFVPAAFMGSFSTFAASGNLVILPSMLLGVLLGLACDTVGEKITSH